MHIEIMYTFISRNKVIVCTLYNSRKKKKRQSNHSSNKYIWQDIKSSSRRLNVCVSGAFTMLDGRLFQVLTIRCVNECFLISSLEYSLFNFLLWPLVWTLCVQVFGFNSLSMTSWSPLRNILKVKIKSPRRRLYFNVGNLR